KKLKIAQNINQVNLSAGLRESMVKIAQYAVIPNYVYDVKGTEEKRQQVLDEITPVTIRAGQVLVKEGDEIDRETYRLIELVGLLDEEKTTLSLLGLVFFVLTITILLAYFLNEIKSKVRSQNTYIFIY